ncbi:MAG: prolipoprotein diacylglyceryl transferase [Ruminococcaceae bacterium]|nr:prolipoprotein diacylglyceryl transferase [Oscillospiraceae bacterium]
MEQVAVQFPRLGLEFNLTREAFVIGDFAIYWYAVIIAVGAVLAVIYGMTQAKKYGVNPDKLIDLVIVALLFGIVGARLYYVIFNIENYKSFADVINIRDGGLGIYGGLILGVLAAYVTSRINKTRFLPCLDLAAGGFFIGQAIGRWGNFVNQEAFGVNTDSIFGMYSEKTQAYLSDVAWDLFKQGVEVDPSAPVHPCFLYESIWCVIGFLLILLYKKYRKFDGELMLFYAAWYGTGRAFIEGLRTDSLMIGDFRVSQVLSIVMVIAAVTAIVLIRVKISKERKTDPEFMQLYVDTKESKAQFMDEPSVILDRAEGRLNEAIGTLNSAQSNLEKIGVGSSDASESLEEMADDLMTDDDIIELAEQQINLALVKISIASSLLEQISVGLKDDEDNSEEEQESEESYDRVEIAAAQIDSARQLINEFFEAINIEREKLKLKDTEQESDEAEQSDRDMHEILDTVHDEEDELDHPSPNESK